MDEPPIGIVGKPWVLSLTDKSLEGLIIQA
jgi:hypothetical protein